MLDTIICLNVSLPDKVYYKLFLNLVFFLHLAVLFFFKSCSRKLTCASRKMEERQPVEQSASFIMRAMRALTEAYE